MELKKLTLLVLSVFLMWERATASAADTSTTFKQAARIVGGEPIKPGEIAHQLSLHVNGDHVCGASLVMVQNIQVAITAAHCLFEANAYVLIGGIVDFGDSEFQQSREVDKIVIHEGFSRFDYSNDLALLFLNSPFQMNDNLSVIALPDRFQETMGNVTLSGWGFLQHGGNAPPDTLQRITIPVISQKVCEEAWKHEFGIIITDKQMCLGDASGNQVPCNGDSGGPATVLQNLGRNYLAGVVSIGDPSCGGHPELPTVITRVSMFVDWIIQKVTEFARIKATY